MAKPKGKKPAKKPAKPRKPPLDFLGFGLVRRAAEAMRKKERKRRKRLGM